MPHGMCLEWNPAVLWTQFSSDAIIALSYFIIPLALVVIVARRQDLKFRSIFYLFGAFIIFCGITHVMAIIVLWIPVYGLQAIVKAATAIVSVLTAIIIWPLIPKICKIPSISQLEEKNEKLNRTNEELNNFSYIASHDLKEPLRGINIISSMIANDYSDK